MAPERRFDVLVVGSGPAGLAASWAAARAGKRVALVDDNPAPGGQIWRGDRSSTSSHGASRVWLDRIERADASLLFGHRVVAEPGPRALTAETVSGTVILRYDSLILATGARERFLPFPGWTLPNVMGAGGLQALVKSGLAVEGQSVVVAGSGPLLLAVAVYLRHRGAKVTTIAEQAPAARVVRFGLGLMGSPSKLFQASRMKLALRGVPYRTGCWPTIAGGEGRVETVTLTDGRRTWDERCDYLACGFGLVPNVELARLLGCEVRKDGVVVDEWQRTSVESVSCAGEATGIGGLEKSLVEGSIAGLAAAGDHPGARGLFPRRARAWKFAASLEAAFALRSELRALARPETIVCRCEDVTLSRILLWESVRAAKLQTRCGMGPCQGRICGPALEFLRGWPADSVRPPVLPARLESLLGGEPLPHL
jgi:NADPH-dependent 2,4-dienoyl-CoA reductase/sulfur reductase-like enzyme